MDLLLSSLFSIVILVPKWYVQSEDISLPLSPSRSLALSLSLSTIVCFFCEKKKLRMDPFDSDISGRKY